MAQSDQGTMDDYTTYCAICGGPFGDFLHEGMPIGKQFPEWMTAPSTIFNLDPGSEYANNKFNSGSDIQHDDLDIYPLAEIAGYDLFDDDHPDHFFPVHSACDQIAIEFFAFANEGENVLGTSRGLHTLVRSEADLYLAFERQFETDVHRRTFPTEKFRLEWDNKSHGAAAYQNVVLDNSPGNAQTGELEQPTLFNQGWIRVEESEVFEADPEHLNISEVTTFIFSFLRRKPSTLNDTEESPPSLAVFRHYIHGRFPTDLQNTLTAHLRPLGALGDAVSLEPLGLLPTEAWRDLLPTTTPWLRGVDFPAAFRRHEPAEAWDWERLARMLAQADAFEPGGCMPGAPSGLRNRRRIWRLLADMEVPRG